MHRIDTPNKQVDLWGAGKPGWRDGNKAAGINPTEFNALMMNTFQEELAGLVEYVGLTLDPANNAQVLLAIQKLIEARTGNFSIDTGAANAYVIALSPAIAAYTGNFAFSFAALNANTGACTINAGGGVVALVNDVGGALVSGDIPAGAIVSGIYELADNRCYITSLVQSQGDARYITQSSLVGAVHYVPMSTAPAGWLKANGALISRSTYAALFAAIGTTFGVGDGATTFGLPDLRGEFIRGWDDSRGVDTGRAIGSAQAGDIQPHVHTLNTYAAGGTTHGQVIDGVTTGANLWAANSSSTGGTETRPRNIALLACIKY